MTRTMYIQSQFIVNPKPFLADLVGKQVLVKLKWGHMEYQGTLNSSDSYMNLYLERTEEIIDQRHFVYSIQIRSRRSDSGARVPAR